MARVEISKQEFRDAMQAAFAEGPLRVDDAIARLSLLHPWFRLNTSVMRSILLDNFGPKLLPPDGTATPPPPAVAPPRARRKFILSDDEAEDPPAPDVSATYTVHMCIICGTFWKRWSDASGAGSGSGWSLYYPILPAGKCCDNVAMAAQIVRVYFTPAALPVVPIPDLSQEPFVQITRDQITASAPKTPGFDLRAADEVLKSVYADSEAKLREKGTWLGLDRSSSPAFRSAFTITPAQIEESKRSPGAFLRAITEERRAVLADLQPRDLRDGFVAEAAPPPEFSLLKALGTPADGAELQDDLRRLGLIDKPWPRGLDGAPLSAEDAAEEFRKLTGEDIDPERIRRILTSGRKSAGFFARALDLFRSA